MRLEVYADTINESAGGIGFALEPGWELRPGANLGIDFRGVHRWAIVRHARILPDGRCFVGVEWQG